MDRVRGGRRGGEEADSGQNNDETDETISSGAVNESRVTSA